MLALVGPGVPDRVRTYLLTFALADDVAGIAVIALAYSGHLNLAALGAGLAILGAVVVVRRRGVRNGPAYLLLGVAAWVAFFESGVDPVVVGLVLGLLALAYPAARSDLEQASESFRLFREQPVPELARDARESVRLAISPNDRLQQLFHPWTSYLIVPLFALANAGITVSGSFLARAYTSPVTLGILLGYVAGQTGRDRRRGLAADPPQPRCDPPAGRLGGGDRRRGHRGHRLHRVAADRLARLPRQRSWPRRRWASCPPRCAPRRSAGPSSGSPRCCPKRLRARALLGTADTIIDLAVPVDPERDHVRGPDRAPVTLVEYGDFECPYCGQAEPVVRELLAGYGDLRYVWRHLPLTDVHPHAQLAAEAAEAAAGQGKFWPMHDQLLGHQDALTAKDLIRYAGELGLDTERFTRDLREHTGQAKIAADVDSADLSGVSGTPTFFINGKRHHGAYDIATLSDAVRTARTRTLISPPGQPRRAS